MKALYTLIVLALLTACSSRTLAPNSAPKVYSDVSPKISSADKSNTDKSKTLTPVHVDNLPPLSTTDSSKHTNTPTTPLESEPFSESKELDVGSRGDEVLALEKRLTELRYDIGKLDRLYDQQTRQGVLAFQKYNQLLRTGTYTLETQKALHKAETPTGHHPELGLPRIEIDITRQILLFFDEKGLNSVVAVSSGTDEKYCEISKKSGKKVCGVATTPRGTFSIQSRIPGWRESDLGKLYNPLYFNGGFAIHGSPSVPAYNASHGCVRISVATSLWFYNAIQNGTPVIVFD